MKQPQPTSSPINAALYFYWISSILTVILVAFVSMFMALGSGLASSPEEPVSSTSQVLWGISGLSFIPAVILLILVTATRKRLFGVMLGLTVIAAGVLAAVGWFVHAGEMPGNTVGNVILIAVALVPMVVGVLLIHRADSLGPAAT